MPKPWGDEDKSFMRIIGMSQVPVVYRDVAYEQVQEQIGHLIDPELYYHLRNHIYTDPLSRRLQRSILDIVTKELLTPKGLRSLSPKSGFYRGYCAGNDSERAYAYLQGGVWSWMVYYYLSAYLKLFRRIGVSFVDRILIPFEDELKRHGICNISELYDGTPPYLSRSATSFMLSATACLRIRNRLEEFEAYNSDDIFDLHLSMTSQHRSSPDAGKECLQEKEDTIE